MEPLTKDMRRFDGSLESFYVSVEEAWETDLRHRYQDGHGNMYGERHGQYVMNSLHAVRPELYLKVTGTLADPFYRDDILPVFWQWLEEEW